MKILAKTFVLIAVLASGAGARAEDPGNPVEWVYDSSLPAACAGITVRYFERIEAQGFLGLATPSAHKEVVMRAMQQNLELNGIGAQTRAVLEKQRLDMNDYYRLQNHFDPGNLPYGGLLGLMGFDFKMGALCESVRQRGLSQVVLACDSDTRTISVYTGRPIDSEEDNLVARCFVSLAQKKSLSWGDVQAARIGMEFDNANSGDFADRAIDGEKGRRDAYVKLLLWAVNSAADAKPVVATPAPSGHDVLGLENCPQTSSQPLVLTSLPH